MDPRIEIEKSQEKVQLTIGAYKDRNKQTILLIWVLFWTACGAFIIFSLLSGKYSGDIKTFLFIWTGFWAYFEYKTVYAYRWRSNGKEVIEINGNQLSIWRMIGKRGVPRHFKLDHVKNLRVHEDTSNQFFKTMSNSYWVVSGETMAFDYHGRLVGFGMQLDQKDASELSSMLKHEVKNRKED